MIDTIVFDLDGTLLDTLEDLAASTNFALRESGYPERSIDEIRTFVGNGVRKLIEGAVPEGIGGEEFERTFASFRNHYREHSLDRTRPYDGVLDMLTEVKAAGYKTAIVSNKLDEAVKVLAERFFVGLIDIAIGEMDGIRRKPAPDMVEKALTSLGSSKEYSIYVGDSDVDIMTGRNSGLRMISVSWGFRDTKFLRVHGASTIIDRPSQLIEVVRQFQ